MKPSILLTAAALVLSSCAGDPTSQLNGLTASENAALAANDPKKVVCRTERVVGSNRARPLCMTVGQWRDQRERSRELKRNAGHFDQDKGSVPVGPGG